VGKCKIRAKLAESYALHFSWRAAAPHLDEPPLLVATCYGWVKTLSSSLMSGSTM